ncbi:MAG: hypothetical protein RLY71_964 [Pseudomonadota bacterium]|jgi:hypothetical protein
MKKILLIGLPYHIYTAEIVAELRAQGHEVSFHDIQPRDLLMKTLRVTARGFYQRRLDAHHLRILAAERGKRYDMVLFIQVHQMAQGTLAALKRAQPGAEFVLYNWDAISNHDYRPYLHAFDRTYTFDPQDARAHRLHYLPLFCVRAFLGLRKREQQRNAIYFVGNIVSVQRYCAIQAFKRYCQQQGITFNSYLACTPYVMIWLLRAGYWPSDVSTRSIDHARFIDMIETATTVFDFANHKQSGYTMRTMENLCAGKKIITGNSGIRNEPFYSPDRILVFDGLDFSQVKAFLDTPLQAPEADFPEFHLSSFVAQLVHGSARPEQVSATAELAT